MDDYIYIFVIYEREHEAHYVGRVLTNHSMTDEELMSCIGYDTEEDYKWGYENGVGGFYVTDDGDYAFDFEAMRRVYRNGFDDLFREFPNIRKELVEAEVL